MRMKVFESLSNPQPHERPRTTLLVLYRESTSSLALFLNKKTRGDRAIRKSSHVHFGLYNKHLFLLLMAFLLGRKFLRNVTIGTSLRRSRHVWLSSDDP